MASETIILVGQTQRDYARQQIAKAPDGYHVVISEPTRTARQNRKLWPMLQDISKQVEWYGQYPSKEDWKNMLTAGLRKSNVVPGIEGGFVTIGHSTSSMGVREFAEFVEYIYAFGAQKDVVWSEPETYDEWLKDWGKA